MLFIFVGRFPKQLRKATVSFVVPTLSRVRPLGTNRLPLVLAEKRCWALLQKLDNTQHFLFEGTSNVHIDVTSRRVRITITAMEKQYLLTYSMEQSPS